MPTIRHRSGPLAGKEQQIDIRSDRITFGRDPSVCDVIFPPDLTLVARRHFALVRKPSGDWIVELFGDPYVSVNGRPAEADQAVHTGDVFELGRSGGPSFEVAVENKDLGVALPVTEVQQKVVGTRAAAARARQMALAGIALAVLAIGGAAGFWYFGRSEGARLEQAVAALTKAQEQAAADSIGPAVRDKLLQAAWIVFTRLPTGQELAGNGTASPIGPNLLATNAHVADAFRKLEPGQKLFVRSPGPNGRTHEIIDVQIHPGYTAFQKYLHEDPIYITSSKECPKCYRIELGGSASYDVAVMRVAPDANLSPILEIASPEELYSLGPGMPIGLAGYPTESIQGREVLPLGPTPNLRTGMINALTDMFNMPGDREHRRLITHNIPVTGGNSGSPMLGSSGKLIALLNSGNVFMTGTSSRMPNAAIINYAQRADLLRELLPGNPPPNLEAERAYWTKQTATFARGAEYIIPKLLDELKPNESATPTLVSEFKYTLAKGDRFTSQGMGGKEVARRQKIHPVSLRPDSPGVFIAYARDKAPIELYLVIDNKIVQQDNRGVFHPAFRYSANKETNAEIYVVGADEDVTYTVVQYTWTPPPS